MKEVFYVAHPVTGDARGNALKAVAWIKWLVDKDPRRVYIAPWVAEVLAYADITCSPEFYDRVLTDDEEVVRRLDGILLVGGRISNGMQRELDAAFAAGKHIVDWSDYATPDQVPEGWLP